MPMIARISSRWMRPPATWSEKPSNHNTKRTTTTVQIKLTIQNLQEMISCYLITAISYYSKVELVSTRVVVARTRALRRLSAARLTGMATAGPGGKPQAILNQEPQLASERHRLGEMCDQSNLGGLPVPHVPT